MDGSAVGNKSLRDKLGWEPAYYFEIRDRLVRRSVLSIGRGYGGSVYLVRAIAAAKPSEESAQAPTKAYTKEKDLYGPIAKALEDGWSRDLGHHNFLVQITSSLGKRATGGMWTRPDITVVAVDSYPYVPGRFIEVVTYEIKPEGSWSVNGVFEAASHSRFATQSYLLLHAPDGQASIRKEHLERLEKECTRFGIGLGLVRKPDSYETYEFLVDPDRRQPDPAEMNRFIEQQLSDESKKHISGWR
jgi:hypothetical protein